MFQNLFPHNKNTARGLTIIGFIIGLCGLFVILGTGAFSGILFGFLGGMMFTAGRSINRKITHSWYTTKGRIVLSILAVLVGYVVTKIGAETIQTNPDTLRGYIEVAMGLLAFAWGSDHLFWTFMKPPV